MPINSKKKGNKAERVVAKLFTEWTGIKFYRTPASGGLHWHKRPDVTGDLTSETPVPFTVEVKSRKEVDMDFFKDSIDIFKFWEQAIGDAQEVNKVPILMFRYNGLSKDLYYVVISLSLFNKVLKSGCKYDSYIKIVKGTDYKIAILTSTEFFKVKYSQFETLLR